MQALSDAAVARNQLVRDEAASLARLALQRPFARRRIEAAQELRLNHLATSKQPV
jgi:hypothetical protein